jgi:hypothetical protein
VEVYEWLIAGGATRRFAVTKTALTKDLLETIKTNNATEAIYGTPALMPPTDGS